MIASRAATSNITRAVAAAKSVPANVVIIGGGGFIGKHVASAFKRANSETKVTTISRTSRPGASDHVSADVLSPTLETVPQVQAASVIVNLVGIMHERLPKHTFHNVHVEGARRIAEIAKKQNAKFVHVSAIVAEKAATVDKIPYAVSKVKGEQAVHESYSDSVIIRPSLVFGPEDDFFNRFAKIAAILPILPVFGGGTTKFQPVYVDDLADAIVKAASPDSKYKGAIIEAGGSKVYTYRELMELTLRESGRWRPIISLPWVFGVINGLILERLPLNLLTITRDQVRLLQHDNIVGLSGDGNGKAISLQEMGLSPKAPEGVLRQWIPK